jgi:hypothetical protein
MDKEALINLINAHEWKEVEFKEAQRNVPKSAYETVSAFANTEGGHLVFGVKKDGENFEIVGVLDVDGVQNSFLSTLRQPDKLSVTQSLIKKISDSMYTLADHLKERLIAKNIDLGTDQVDSKKNDLVSDQVKPGTTDLVTDQVKPLTNLNDVQWKIVMKCDVPMKMLELLDHVGVKHRNFFKKTHLQPLLDGGIIQMTNPDKPRASNQKYVLTEVGVQLKIRQKEKLE